MEKENRAERKKEWKTERTQGVKDTDNRKQQKDRSSRADRHDCTEKAPAAIPPPGTRVLPNEQQNNGKRKPNVQIFQAKEKRQKQNGKTRIWKPRFVASAHMKTRLIPS